MVVMGSQGKLLEDAWDGEGLPLLLRKLNEQRTIFLEFEFTFGLLAVALSSSSVLSTLSCKVMFKAQHCKSMRK